MNLKIIKHCLESTQIGNKKKQLENYKTDVDSFRKIHKEFIKDDKSIVKSQQRFRSEKHNAYTE